MVERWGGSEGVEVMASFATSVRRHQWFGHSGVFGFNTIPMVLSPMERHPIQIPGYTTGPPNCYSSRS